MIFNFISSYLYFPHIGNYKHDLLNLVYVVLGNEPMEVQALYQLSYISRPRISILEKENNKLLKGLLIILVAVVGDSHLR